ncbi:hypothetical protein L6164_023254 [Bauhinia variegata]|uniref:Uncharacterized protein n=1 Tax=Bauhinia variegata TaxID=167791 RepID=A0ACB9MHP2_BAUVA|nr:hypothetical protein L6164_023254 [Bauhinia variegata]
MRKKEQSQGSALLCSPTCWSRCKLLALAVGIGSKLRVKMLGWVSVSQLIMSETLLQRNKELEAFGFGISNFDSTAKLSSLYQSIHITPSWWSLGTHWTHSQEGEAGKCM